jgi:2,4-dienoyl-CoA reductase
MSDSRPQAKYFPAVKTPMLPPGTFKGRTALITGGGTGLGKGMALMLSQLGAAVAIIGRRQAVIEDTARELQGMTGNKVIGLSADVRSPDGVKEAIDQIEKELGLPSLIVNNAAGNFISPAERITPNGWKSIVDIVLTGTANVTLDMGRRLIANQQGASFLAITTTYTLRGSGFVAPSAAAKSGVQSLMRSLASEWGRYGIRLNCLAPGPIETEGAFSRLDPTGSFKEQMLNSLPTGRLGSPEELANLAAYLLSDYSAWMTGETVTLDGGESVFNAGEFNKLVKVTDEQWDQLAKIIKESSAKQKKKSSSDTPSSRL